VAAPNENAGRDAAPADKGRAPARHEASSTRETERRVDRAAAGSTDRSEARPSPAGAASDDGGTSGATAVAEGLSAIDRAAPIRDRDPESAPDTLLELTTELMRRGGFPSRCEVLPDEYQLVRIVTDDESAGRLIGRHGSGVDAVEHLVDRMATQAFGQRVKLNLDINNYRRKRESQLVERAQAAVAAVRETGREQRLEPLCARERRVVHLEVMKSDGLTSYTVQGPEGKQVVVALDGGQPRADAVVGEADGDAT
jgi:spoIIIJ-associated protein